MARANAAYYSRHDPFQDFTTAPEISQMFGEILGVWAMTAWVAAGRPAPFLLVEAGPGRGTLMRDLLRAVRTAMPACAAAARVHFIETSPSLRAKQAALVPDAVWHDGLHSLPPEPMILLANEFLDALPIRQFVRRTDGWTERYVDNGAWVELPADASLVPVRPDVRDGAIIEVNEAARTFVAAVADRLLARTGAALFVDYGPAESGPGDSLQAIAGKRAADPLADPGHADLTAHVDFSDLAGVARARGATVLGPALQGTFLTAWGLPDRTRMLARAQPRHAEALRQAAARLTNPEAMGVLFKVMAITPPRWPDLLLPGAVSHGL
ncbi:MAG TPA: SAM-dependent methyltransferase [Rhodopila sp.]|uniref:class I SAM-dependent methyltransferase n=1 Tax=Rhodopila sp. TaxID=2480087 RepID=UPI002C54D19C|nr:SAM-dependent methyltransferase [Rhodopila sp.]HVY14575.1 SAM-dependent methyltransferase [Rhodopila sp.]